MTAGTSTRNARDVSAKEKNKKIYGCNTSIETEPEGETKNPYSERCRFTKKFIDPHCEGCER